jgi:hypothetical protein
MIILICNIVIGGYLSLLGMILNTKNFQSFLIFKGIPWVAGVFLIITSVIKLVV